MSMIATPASYDCGSLLVSSMLVVRCTRLVRNVRSLKLQNNPFLLRITNMVSFYSRITPTPTMNTKTNDFASISDAEVINALFPPESRSPSPNNDTPSTLAAGQDASMFHHIEVSTRSEDQMQTNTKYCPRCSQKLMTGSTSILRATHKNAMCQKGHFAC